MNNCTSDDQAIAGIHQITALTHNHQRAKIASGLQYFMVKELVYGKGSMLDRLQAGLDEGFRYYGKDLSNLKELTHFGRLFYLKDLQKVPVADIRSTGYVIDTIEAAIWCLITTDSYKACMLKAVNLGDDTDTVAAIAGGMAGIYYGYKAIPEEWLKAIQKREWLEDMFTWNYAVDIPVADIHIHGIPNVDDGSTSIDMTMEMIRSEYRQGVRAIMLTPHADGLEDVQTFLDGLKAIKRRCETEYPNLKIGIGCEIYCRPAYMDEIVACLEQEILLSMNATEYVLVEFPVHGMTFKEMEYCVKRLLEAGWTPIIAHAERFGEIYTDIQDVKHLKELGCLIQMNGYSFVADSSVKRRHLAQQMVDRMLVDFIGTDAHRMTHRPPKLARAVREMLARYDHEYVKHICYDNAIKLLYTEG